MPSWSVGYPERERVEVVIRPRWPNDGGYDWIHARVRIDVGGFRGEFDMTMLADEMYRFKCALEPVYRDLLGAAEFVTIEDQLHLKVEVDKLGHVTVTGYAKDDASFGNRLSFELCFDQTLLWHTICELDEVLFELEQSAP